MNVVFLAQFARDIEKLRLQTIREQIAETIEVVEQAQTMADITNLKKLKGFKTAYRIRFGDYRIGVFIENDTVEFARVVHRKDIYKVFP
jgi:mRNA interferase RelE/StbE